MKLKKITWKDVKTFISKNRVPMVQCALMVGVVAVGTDCALANSIGSKVDNAGINSIDALINPMNNMMNFMTGPAPKAIGTVGIGIAGASWALNIENQITKAGMRLLGGTGAAIGGASVLGGLTSIVMM